MTAPRSARSAWLLVGSTPAAVGEGPQRRPGLEQVARHPARVLVARRLARVAAQDRLELAAQQPNAATELAPLAGVLVDLPGPERLRADPKARLSELALGGETFGVGFKVALQVRPADLAAPG